MVRRRNDETIAAAWAAARDIMLESGYNAASYSAIAERAGIARTTVQHYFPSKEMFATRLMTEIADVSQKHALQIAPEGATPLAVYYLTAQVSYGIFYLTDGMRQFLADLVATRNLQHAAAPDYIEGAVEMLSLRPPNDEALFDLQYAIGGIYEMHYIFLREGKIPELSRLVRNVIRVIARMLGVSRKECERVIDEHSLTNEELFAIGRKLIKEI